MSKKAVIDVGLRIDVKDQLNSIKSEIESLSKVSSKGMSTAMAKEMTAIQETIKEIEESMKKISSGKLNTDTFKKANDALMSQINNLEARTSALEHGMKDLIDTMSKTDGGKMASTFQNIASEMDTFRTNMQNSVTAIKEFQDVAEKTNVNIHVANDKDISNLEKEKKDLEDILAIINGELTDSSIKIDTSKAKKQIDELLKKVMAADRALDEMEEEPKKYNAGAITAKRKELALYLNDLYAVTEKSDLKLGKALAEEIDDTISLVTDRINEFESQVKSRLKEVTDSISNASSGVVSGVETKVTGKTGKLSVPLSISTSPTTLKKQALAIINKVQDSLQDSPLEVEFVLVSAYSSKKANTLLKDFQKEINDLEDEATRLDFQDLFNRLTKDFQKKINIEVTADVGKESQKVKAVIKELQSSLDEKLRIFPKIEPDEKEIGKIQSILDDISKSLTLTIGNVTLSESATKKLKAVIDTEKKTAKKEKKATIDSEEMAKIKELSKSIESVTDGINSQLDEINSGSLQPIIASFQQIGQLLMVIMQSTTAIPDSVSDITSNIKEMITVMQRGFGLLTNDELDSKFANIQDKVSKINGDLRGGDKNKRVLELKELIKLYKEYQNLGGKKTVEDLGGAKNVQKWLQSHVNDDVFSTEALGLNKVGESVDAIGKKIDSKNERFKEEANIVKSVASEETKALKDVVDILQQMFENLAQINQKGFDDWKIEDWRKAISDTLSSIKEFDINSLSSEKLSSLMIKVEPLIDPVVFSNEVTTALSTVTAEIKVIPSFEPDEFKSEIEKYLNTDNASKEITNLTEDILQLSDAEAHLAQGGDLSFVEESKYLNKTSEELEKCLKDEERWLKQCKEGSDAYNKRRANIEEINSLLQKTDSELGTTESSNAIQDESNAFDKITEGAKTAAEEKEKFAEANKEVLSSILESVKGLADESGAFDGLNKLIKNLSKQEGMENTINNLQAIADLLKTEVSDSSILSVLKDIAAQGTDLGDIASLIKASRKEIENAKKAVDKAEGKDTTGPTVIHNGVPPFIEKGSDDWKFINEQVEKHKEELGEVLEIYRKVDGELESFSVKTTKGNTMIFGKDSEDQWIASIQRIQDFKDQYKESLKLIKSLQGADGLGGFIDKQQTKIDSKVDRERVQYTKEYLEELDKAESKLQELNAILVKNESIDIWDEKDISTAKELQEEIKKITDGLSKGYNQAIDSKTIDKLLTKINTDLKDNTKMTPELRERFIQLRAAVDEYRNSSEKASKVDFKPLAAEFQHLHEEMLRTGQTGKSFFQSIAEAAKSQTTQFIARYFSLQDWIRYAQQAFEKVKSIDSALTELRKVSDASTSRLTQNFEASSKAAQDLGHSISGVINITADWARLGYSVDDAEKLARITTMFQTVGDNMSTETASQYMISTLQGFQLGVDKAEEITDKYNEVKCWLPLYSKNPYMDRVQLCLF